MAATKRSKKSKIKNIDELVSERTRTGIKHLVECRCILPQFKNVQPTVFHKFVVFSELDETAEIIPAYTECSNCGVVHRVIEIGFSEILKKESSNSVPKIADIKLGLPERLSIVLEKYECDLATWQEAAFIVRNKQWGKGFVVSQERVENKVFGKFIVILGENLFQVNDFEREEGLL